MDSGGRKRKNGKRNDRASGRSSGKPQVKEEPEDSLTQEEYESLKYNILKRAVLCENQYVELRTEHKGVRAVEVANYREQVETGMCQQFLAEKEKLLKEKQRKHDLNRANYELKMAQILDEYEARAEMNRTQHDDQYAYAKGRFIDFFTELIAEKERRENEVGQIMAAMLQLPPRPTARTQVPILKTVAESGRQTRSRSRSPREDDPETTSRCRQLKLKR